MTLSAIIGGIDLSDRVRLVDGLQSVTSAADGSFGSSAIRLDDPDGNLTVDPWSYVTIEEDDCTPPRCFTGYVYNQTVERGPYRTGPGRVLVLDIIDLNGLLSLRVLRASDANRPAEDGDARMAWLLASVGLSGLVYDNGQIGANVLQFDAADFRGQYANDVLSSLCVSAGGPGVIFFVYWDHAATQPSLFFRPPTAALYDSTLRLSNVLSDIDDSVTFWAYAAAEKAALGEDIYDGVLFNYVGGSLYRQRTSTYTAYGIHRDAVFESSRIRSATLAASRAEVFLDNHAGPTDTITCTVRLPSSKINLLEAGHRVSVKFSHLPGFSSFTWTRGSRRTFALTPGTNDYFDVQLELTTKGITTIGGGGDPGDFPNPPSTPPYVVQQVSGTGNLTMPSPITDGNTLVYVGGKRGGAATLAPLDTYTLAPDGVANDAQNGMAVYYKIASGDPQTMVGSGIGSDGGGTWFELPGTQTPSTSNEASGVTVNLATSAISAPANSIVLAGAVQGWGGAYDSVAATLTFSPAAGWTEDFDSAVSSGHPNIFVAHRIASAAASISAGATNSGNGGLSGTDYSWLMQIVAFTGDAADSPPAPGQWIDPPEVVSMSGDDGTTAFPFADGSLHVFVDDTDQTAKLTAQDGAAGTFTLGFTPTPTEVVTASYQGR